MKNLVICLLSFILLSFLACRPEKEKTPLSAQFKEKSFIAFKAIKENNSKKFFALFDQNSIRDIPESEKERIFKSYHEIFNHYDIVSYPAWEKDHLHYAIDSVSSTLEFSLPLKAKPTSLPEYFIQVRFDAYNKRIINFTMTHVPEADEVREEELPYQRASLDITVRNIRYVKFMHAPGTDAGIDQVRVKEIPITYSSNRYFLNDVKAFLDTLRTSPVVSMRKFTIKEEAHTNEYKAIQVVSQERGMEITFSVVKNGDQLKLLEYYTANAARLYTVSPENTARISSKLDTLISKYLKE
jgi:hypothetical protein